jgi:hypothetical protein
MYGDTRGQVVQIAAILALAIAVLAFASYQATVVPSETAVAEAAHDSETKSQMLSVDRAIRRTADTGRDSALTVQLSPRYPPRLLALNPSPRSGTLQTTPLDGQGVAIGGFTCSEPSCVANDVGEDEESSDYWTGGIREYPTNRLAYQARYNRYPDAPRRTWEASVLYDQFGNATIARSDQRLIDGETIRLTALRGNYSRTGRQRETIETRAVSAPARTVPIRDDGNPITLTIRTDIPNATWKSLLEDEVAPDGHVTSFSCQNPNPDPCGTLTIELEQGITYDLETSAVGIGQNATDTDPSYIVGVKGNDTTIPVEGRQKVVPEVRDQYNNPYAGERIYTANVSQDDYEGYLDGTLTCSGLDLASSNVGTVSPEEQLSDESGQAPFVYEAPDTVDGRNETFVVVTAIDPNDTLSGTVNACDLLDLKPEYRAGFYVTVYDIRSFRNVNVTNLIAGDVQQQTLNFTFSGGMSSQSNVVIDLSNANGGNNAQPVAYGAATVNDTASTYPPGDIGFRQNGDELVYNPDADVPDGTTVEIVLDNVESQDIALTGLDVVFNRDDGSPTTDSFDIVDDSAGLAGVGATDLPEDATGETQKFNFTLDSDLPDGETVTINLDDAQIQNNGEGVDYSNVDQTDLSTDGSGTMSIDVTKTGNQGTARITYEAGSTDIAGDNITITVDNVETTSQGGGQYTTSFSRSDGGSMSTTFLVEAQVGSAGDLEHVSGTTTTGAQDDHLQFDINNTASQEIRATRFAVDATDIDSGAAIKNSGPDDEMTINGGLQDGFASPKGNNVFQADGTVYDYEPDGHHRCWRYGDGDLPGLQY